MIISTLSIHIYEAKLNLYFNFLSLLLKYCWKWRKTP